MSYIVRVEIGKGKNRAVSQSIPLPKKRVCNHIKEHPFVKLNTNIKVTNTNNKRTQTGKQYQFCSKINGKLP